MSLDTPLTWSQNRGAMIGRVVSHYEILAKLGEGGMGVLYNGWDFPFAGGWGMGPRRQVGAS